MKKLLSFVIMLGLAYSMNAQFTIVYNDVDMTDGDTITVRAEGEDLEFMPQFRNNSENTETVVVSLDPVSSTNIAVMNVCAGIHCYSRNYTDPFDIDAGALYTQFHSEMMVPSPTDKGLFRLKIYRSSDNSVHTDLYVMFLGSEATVGIDNVSAPVEMVAYPNPATQSVNVRYSMNESKGSLVLYNMQGAKVREQALTATEGIITIQLDGLAAGIYMYGIEGDGIQGGMKKLVVR